MVALKWVVGGAGQGYVEKDAQGRWCLHTTGPGTISLALYALGSNGVAAEKRAQVEVADD